MFLQSSQLYYFHGITVHGLFVVRLIMKKRSILSNLIKFTKTPISNFVTLVEYVVKVLLLIHQITQLL
jgi:hypothetical protein